MLADTDLEVRRALEIDEYTHPRNVGLSSALPRRGPSVVSGEPHPSGACWPGVPALPAKYFLGNGDLLRSAGVVGGARVGPTTIASPRPAAELQPAVVPIAGIGAPVTPALALRQSIPFILRRAGLRRCREH